MVSGLISYFEIILFVQERKKKATTIGRSKKVRQKIDDEDDDDEDEEWIKVDRGALEKPKMFDKDAEITHDLVVKKLIEIMAAR